MALAAAKPQVWQPCVTAKGWAGPGRRRGEGMLLLRAGGAAVAPPPSFPHHSSIHSPPPTPSTKATSTRATRPPPSSLPSPPPSPILLPHVQARTHARTPPAPSLPAWQQTDHNSTHSHTHNTRTHAHASRPSGNLEGCVTHRPEGVGLPPCLALLTRWR